MAVAARHCAFPSSSFQVDFDDLSADSSDESGSSASWGGMEHDEEAAKMARRTFPENDHSDVDELEDVVANVNASRWSDHESS